jgi:hypothetical protein
MLLDAARAFVPFDAARVTVPFDVEERAADFFAGDSFNVARSVVEFFVVAIALSPGVKVFPAV